CPRTAGGRSATRLWPRAATATSTPAAMGRFIARVRAAEIGRSTTVAAKAGPTCPAIAAEMRRVQATTCLADQEAKPAARSIDRRRPATRAMRALRRTARWGADTAAAVRGVAVAA